MIEIRQDRNILKIIKNTSDRIEIDHCKRLFEYQRAKSTKHLPLIYNMSINFSNYGYSTCEIEREYIDEMSEYNKEMYNLIWEMKKNSIISVYKYIYHILTKKIEHSDINLMAYVNMTDVDSLQFKFLKKMVLPMIFEMVDVGILTMDLHSKNIGEKNGKLVLFDFGYSL